MHFATKRDIMDVLDIIHQGFNAETKRRSLATEPTCV